jgi:small subunit ribosomal protein S1
MKLEAGFEHDFKIVKMTPEEKKIGLSIRAVGEEASRQEVGDYKQQKKAKPEKEHKASSGSSSSSSSSSTTTLGEMIKWKSGSDDK